MSMPFEQARTLMAAGDVHRRARRKREAQAALERALIAFTGLGARIWAARASSDLEHSWDRQELLPSGGRCC